jgi:hypothetical protein
MVAVSLGTLVLVVATCLLGGVAMAMMLFGRMVGSGGE